MASGQDFRNVSSGSWHDEMVWEYGDVPFADMPDDLPFVVIRPATEGQTTVVDYKPSTLSDGMWNPVYGLVNIQTPVESNRIAQVTQTAFPWGGNNFGRGPTVLSTNSMRVGGANNPNEGIAKYDIVGGKLNALANLQVGFGSGGRGTMLVAGEAVVEVGVAEDLDFQIYSFVGGAGQGTIQQTGGYVRFGTNELFNFAGLETYELILGAEGGRGTYEMFGGELDVDSLLLGYGENALTSVPSVGTFLQSGGEATVHHLLRIGVQRIEPRFNITDATAPGTGSYLLSGGLLNLASGMVVGEAGEGSFTQTGGTLNGSARIGGATYPLYMPAGQGTVTIQGGTVNGGFQLFEGSFLLDGGVVNGLLGVYKNTAEIRSGTLNGGLNILREGEDQALVKQTGGNVVAPVAGVVGGRYELTGGALSVAGNLSTEGKTGLPDSGVFQTGGIVDIEGDLGVKATIYRFDGGSLAVAGNARIGAETGSSLIDLRTGGAEIAGTVFLGTEADETGTLNVSGNTFSAGEILVGDEGTGYLSAFADGNWTVGRIAVKKGAFIIPSSDLVISGNLSFLDGADTDFNLPSTSTLRVASLDADGSQAGWDLNVNGEMTVTGIARLNVLGGKYSLPTTTSRLYTSSTKLENGSFTQTLDSIHQTGAFRTEAGTSYSLTDSRFSSIDSDIAGIFGNSGGYHTASGRLKLEGATSEYNLTGLADLQAGSYLVEGSLNHHSSNLVSGGQMTVAAGGTFMADAGPVQLSGLTIMEGGSVRAASQGFTVTGGVTADGTLRFEKSATLGSISSGIAGSVIVSGATTTLRINNPSPAGVSNISLADGAGLVAPNLGEGSLDWEDGTSLELSSQDVYVGFGPGSSGALRLGNSLVLDGSRELILGQKFRVQGGGDLSIRTGADLEFGSLEIVGASSFSITGGNLDLGTADFSQSESPWILSGGTLAISGDLNYDGARRTPNPGSPNPFQTFTLSGTAISVLGDLNAGAYSHITLGGTNGGLSVDGAMTLAENASDDVLFSISGGRALANGSALIGDRGFANFQNSAIHNVTGLLEVGARNFNAQTSQYRTFSSGSLTAGALSVGSKTGGKGKFENGGQLSVSGIVSIAPEINSSGEFVNLSGGNGTVFSLSVGGDGTGRLWMSDGTLTATSETSIRGNSRFDLTQGIFTSPTLVNEGTVEILPSGGVLRLRSAVDNRSSWIAGRSFSIDQSGLSHNNSGTIDLRDGCEISFGLGNQLNGAGTVVGNGWFNGSSFQWNNSGIIAPGSGTASTGQIRSSGTLTLGATSRLRIDISSASSFDTVRAFTLAQNGTLEIDLAPGYSPAIGTAFTVLIANNRSGTIQPVLSALAPGRAWDTSDLQSTGTLRIVSAPIDPVTAWRITHFGDSISDPALENILWGDLASPARDGVPNLLKYALGLTPYSTGPAGLPAVTHVPGAMNLRYRPVGTGISFIVKQSPDLMNWTDIGVNQGTLAVDGFVEASIPVVEEVDAKFLRLEVRRTQDE